MKQQNFGVAGGRVGTNVAAEPSSSSASFLGSRTFIVSCCVLATVLADLGAVSGAGVLAEQFRFGLQLADNPKFVYLVLPFYLPFAWALGAYKVEVLQSLARSGARAGASLGVSFVVVVFVIFALQAGTKFSRLETFYFACTALAALIVGRAAIVALLYRLREAVAPRIIIIGDGAVSPGKEMASSIDVRTLDWEPRHDKPEILERIFRRLRGADRILLSFSDPAERTRWAQVMRLTGLNAEVLEPRLEEVAPLGLYHWGRVPTLVIARRPLGLQERAVKRGFDLILLILAAPVVLPLVALLALLVRLETPGPAFFVQTRVGLNNRPYRCLKLRTMRSDFSDAAGNKSTERNDPRITRLGYFLRRTSLDELPQLWNVFKGDMSLVGPRPHALGSTAGGSLFWEVVPTYWGRHCMKPGLTGLAQVRGYRGATHNKRDLELRVASDMEYINSWSLWLDVKILLRSFLVLIHHNAY